MNERIPTNLQAWLDGIQGFRDTVVHTGCQDLNNITGHGEINIQIAKNPCNDIIMKMSFFLFVFLQSEAICAPTQCCCYGGNGFDKGASQTKSKTQNHSPREGAHWFKEKSPNFVHTDSSPWVKKTLLHKRNITGRQHLKRTTGIDNNESKNGGTIHQTSNSHAK